ncbi:MAG: hypothetical protein KIT33_04630 [Candidatus Kapabacteria bacterium]|nr:hypothetical protein [Ignavibacteriota bacterium]MCW5884243.1 hypothetical protein [Candidatus Kapabacteria bacterium]
MSSVIRFISILLGAFIIATSVNAQFPNLKKAKELIKEKKTEVETKAEPKVSEDNIAETPKILKQDPVTVVFSTFPIDPKNPQSLSNEFKAGDYIYALAKLPATIKELTKDGRPEVIIFIYHVKPPQYSYLEESEEQLVFGTLRVSGDALLNDYINFEIAPNPENTISYGNPNYTFKPWGKKYTGPVEYTETLSKLESGSHKLKIVIRCPYDEAAAGVLKISGDNFNQYAKLSNDLNDFAHNAGAKSAEFPKASKSDAKLEKQMIEALKKSNDWAKGRFENGEVIKIVIVDPDWHIRRHQISGAILHRYIRAAIGLKFKDGSCAYYQVTYQEDYIGNKFQALKYDGAGDKHAISCDNIK